MWMSRRADSGSSQCLPLLAPSSHGAFLRWLYYIFDILPSSSSPRLLSFLHFKRLNVFTTIDDFAFHSISYILQLRPTLTDDAVRSQAFLSVNQLQCRKLPRLRSRPIPFPSTLMKDSITTGRCRQPTAPPFASIISDKLWVGRRPQAGHKEKVCSLT